MTAQLLDLTLEEGVDFELPLNVSRGDQPEDITGWTFLAQIRLRYDTGNPALAVMVQDIQDAEGGLVVLSLSATAIANLTPRLPSTTPRKRITQFAWDLKATDGDGKSRRFYEGVINLVPAVSK